MATDWLSREELSKLTPQIMAERVKAIVPLAAKHAQEAERIRKPVDEVWNALRKAGIFYHFVPKKYGGLEWSVEDFLRIMLPLGAACSSTAWVATFCMEHNWILAGYGDKAQDEIFGQFPYIIAPGLIFPPCQLEKVDGGYRANGRLKWGTGVMHADWVIASGMLKGSNPPEMRSMIVPIKDVKVVDIWHVDGMAGTGSNDVEFENTFVPEHRTVPAGLASIAQGVQVHDNVIYHVPKIPFLALTAAIAPVGTALGAVEYFRDYMKSRMQKGNNQSHAERPAVQMRLGKAQIKAQTAETLLYNAARRMTEMGHRGGEASIEERMSLRIEIAYAAELSRLAVHELYEAAGSSAHYLDSPLQRMARDVSMMATHGVFDFDNLSEQNGRVHLGMKPTIPLL